MRKFNINTCLYDINNRLKEGYYLEKKNLLHSFMRLYLMRGDKVVDSWEATNNKDVFFLFYDDVFRRKKHRDLFRDGEF